MRQRTARIVIVTLAAAVAVGIAGVWGFLQSGIYEIAAIEPHRPLVRSLIVMLQRNAVEERAEDVEVPPLDDPVLVRRGAALYAENCVVCHGAPGVTRAPIGLGLNPDAPPLVNVRNRLSDAEIYWIIRNGLKMAGMPAFGIHGEPDDMWALTAFVKRMQGLPPVEYARMVAAVEGRVDPGEVQWSLPEGGWARLRAEGSAERGKALIDAYGCGSCHRIPGIRGADGLVGPPLEDFIEQAYIAGHLPNVPDALVAWLMDPPALDPGTAMPDLGIAPQPALDIAAYLYTRR